MQARTFAIALTLSLVSACGRNETPESPAAAAAAPAPATASEPASPATGTPAMPLQKTDLSPGSGAEIKAGQTALVHYTGWLYDAATPENKGKQFDSSVGGEPFEFAVGAGHVIAGWDQGVAGMKVGGKRRLVIPPDLGYGARGAGGGVIPPNATLLFDVELVEIR
jgi:FKBP-type peptidyl-prolyl cis-trans isomerase FkpA